MPHCWKFHAMAHLLMYQSNLVKVIPIHHLITEQLCTLNNQILPMLFLNRVRIMCRNIIFILMVLSYILIQKVKDCPLFFEGVVSQNLYKMMYFGSEFFFLANSADPLKMLWYVALHLGLQVCQYTQKVKNSSCAFVCLQEVHCMT